MAGIGNIQPAIGAPHLSPQAGSVVAIGAFRADLVMRRPVSLPAAPTASDAEGPNEDAEGLAREAPDWVHPLGWARSG